MYILGIDTSNGYSSASLFKEEVEILNITDDSPNSQVENLIPNIEKILDIENISYKDLSYIACNIGPGSFTGVRIGLSAAKALSFINKVKTLCVTSFEVIAAEIEEDNFTVVLDARRGQVYTQSFNGVEPKSKPEVYDVSDIDLKDFLVAGNGAKLVNSKRVINDKIPNAKFVVLAAIKKLNNNLEFIYQEPLYIRKPV